MYKQTNRSKFTTIQPQCKQLPGADADLFALYRSGDLAIESVEYENCSYHLYARCVLDYGKCPYCGHMSHRVHSRYIRTISDLSILGRPVIITSEMRKFFCDNTECTKKTFAEQPGNEVFRYRRRTRRCEMAVMRYGLTSSSETARKLLNATGVSISGDTVLRDLHRMAVPGHDNVSRIGVDDWAFRKGVTYGSIVVDLDTGEVIDLLGDRASESFQDWLDRHENVSLVSRDRSTDYSAAIMATGRNIVEVADRFHLSKNMSDCLTKVIGNRYEDYRKAVRPEEPQSPGKKDSRQIMFDEVKELQAKGLNIGRIAKELGIARQTVRKYMRYDSLLPRASKERHPYHLYDSYVEDEYRRGKDLLKIYHEIKGKGFKGSLTPFYDHYHYLSDGHRGSRPKDEVEQMRAFPGEKRTPLLPIRHIAHIAAKSIWNHKMSHEEKALVDRMMTFGWFREIHSAAASFHTAIMGNDTAALNAWIGIYEHSSITELRSFTYGLKIDKKAVTNSISYDISNGIVEGFVNKLKVVKRMMYGRASLELLKRKMVLCDLVFN